MSRKNAKSTPLRMLLEAMLLATFLSTPLDATAVQVDIDAHPVYQQHKKHTKKTSGVEHRYGKTFVGVHIPFALHHVDGYGHVFAEYGSLSSGSATLAASVIESPHTLCTAIHNTSILFDHHEDLLTPFVLYAAHDASCSYVTQTRHAQQAGAAGLVLGDTICMCDHADCVKEFHENNSTCRKDLPVLSNDGSANADIGIPTVLVFKQAANLIASKVAEPMLIEITWGIPEIMEDDENHDKITPQLQVPTAHLWWSSYDHLIDIETLQNIRYVVQAFNNKTLNNDNPHPNVTQTVTFEPRYTVLRGQSFGCRVNGHRAGGNSSTCDHLCTHNGRYCALHARGLSGLPIVRETLRQLCIWDHVEHSDNQDQYWHYVLYHRRHCFEPHTFADEECILKAYKEANIAINATDNSTYVEACIGNIEHDQDHPLLDQAIAHQRRAGIYNTPALSVNHQLVQPRQQDDSSVSSFGLFESVCDDYWQQASHLMGFTVDESVSAFHMVPAICHCQRCPNPWSCWSTGECEGDSSHSGNNDGKKHHEPSKPSGKRGGRRHGRVARFFGWMLLLSLFCGGGYYVYKNYYLPNRMQQGLGNRDAFGSEGAGLLTSYFQMT